MKTQFKPTADASNVRALWQSVLQRANEVGHKLVESFSFGPALIPSRVQVPSGGFSPSQGGRQHGVSVGFNSTRSLVALAALTVFFGMGNPAQAQQRGDVTSTGQTINTQVRVQTPWQAAQEAVQKVDAQMFPSNGSGYSFSTLNQEYFGDAVSRPSDETMRAAFTLLGRVIGNEQTNVGEKAQALAVRGSLRMLAASFSGRGFATFPGTSEAQLKKLGSADLEQAIALLPRLQKLDDWGDAKRTTLEAIAQAVIRDFVVTPSEESLLGKAFSGAGPDYDNRAVVYPMFSRAFIPDNRPDLAKFAFDVTRRFVEIGELGRHDMKAAAGQLNTLFGELRQAEAEDGDRGVLAAQLHLLATHGPGTSWRLGDVASEAGSPTWGAESEAELLRLSMYLMDRCDPHHMAMYSIVPDRILWQLEREGRTAELVSVAKKYMTGFDKAPVVTGFHMIAMYRLLPLVNKYDPGNAKAVTEQFVRQAKAQIVVDPEAADRYRWSVKNALDSTWSEPALTPEMRGVLQNFFESLPPAKGY